MPTWMVDVTLCDRDLSSDQALGIVREMVKLYPEATVEDWRRDKVRFYRIISFVQAATMRDVFLLRLAQVFPVMEQLGIHGQQPGAISIAIRDTSFDVYDTMPPAARRAIRGGRPPKNPPPGV